MLDNWEALIPFYVAGTLSREETAHLEKVLAHNAEARRSLEEWRGIAAAVRADAARQLRDLPPLSAQVIAQANAQAADRRYFQPQIAASERSAAPVVKRRAAPLSITMLAAVFTVVIFGGLLAFMVLRGIDPRQQGAPAVVLQPSVTPSLGASATPDRTAAPTRVTGQIIVIEPSATPITPPPTATNVPPTRIPPTRIPPTRIPPTAILPPTIAPTATADLFALSQLADSPACAAHVAIPGGIVSFYAGRSAADPLIYTLTTDETAEALARSEDGWIRAQLTRGADEWIGWARQESLYLSGACDALPLLPAASPTPTATHTVLPFPTTSAAP